MKLPMALSPHHLDGKKLIISGAGIAGPAFLISLARLWRDSMGKFPEVVLYERSDKVEAFRDGYSLSLHSGGFSPGMQALQKMDLLNQLLEHGFTKEAHERSYLGLWSLDWRKIVPIRKKHTYGLPVSSMRIARSKLRQVLLDAAKENGTVVSGVSCTEVLSCSDPTIRVKLSNENEDTCDILIVADGASSKIRRSLRPTDNPSFGGVVSICATANFAGPPPEPVCRHWGLIPSGKGVALFAAPFDSRSVFWSLSYTANKPRQQGHCHLSAEGKKYFLQEAQERGAIFREPFQTLMRQTDTDTLTVINTKRKVPFPHNEASGVPQGIFFIGDSNHTIDQFAGAGANLALLDGYDLAECLLIYESLQTVAATYDRRSMPRAIVAARRAQYCISLVHSKGLRWVAIHSALLLAGAVLPRLDSVKVFFRRIFA